MDDLSLSMDELSELARMALAAMDSEPVIIVGDDGGDALSYRRLIQSFAPGTKLYRHAQPAPVVPGKWIPVSERMPEIGDIVLTAMGGVVNVGETECSAANCRFFTSVISGRELPATHWMPLPAAPQEVNRE
ncbi:Eaa1 [Klebsiella pneumoniae]|nr:Eaa1 [Klebsiella pneumoniae]SAR40782.1 Eaa1 [Klebsiella pneumoniae]SAR51663.1 Eaa1 [Klebsiella pneumoniae]SAR54526.1 Eaa1 [Klebsiella pneumoniae]SAR56678.1 Eaa1 [Klebsiella pneumoniae]